MKPQEYLRIINIPVYDISAITYKQQYILKDVKKSLQSDDLINNPQTIHIYRQTFLRYSIAIICIFTE